MDQEARMTRQLWVEDKKGRRRMPDPVRRAAVRALLLTSVTLIQAMVAFFAAMSGSWLAFPTLLTSVASTVVATWSVLDVWVTRQVWRQRNGVVSEPSSTARQLRRERRRAEKAGRGRAPEGAPGHSEPVHGAADRGASGLGEPGLGEPVRGESGQGVPAQGGAKVRRPEAARLSEAA
ncbi:hypothetical protein [Streptomyces sp. NPDC008121]|uniref:hypothetical protein n=1 Tax=Streptomyces sp. NPDC008121 TaxID=3364809 RepID=UPI0036F0FBA4